MPPVGATATTGSGAAGIPAGFADGAGLSVRRRRPARRPVSRDTVAKRRCRSCPAQGGWTRSLTCPYPAILSGKARQCHRKLRQPGHVSKRRREIRRSSPRTRRSRLSLSSCCRKYRVSAATQEPEASPFTRSSRQHPGPETALLQMAGDRVPLRQQRRGHVKLQLHIALELCRQPLPERLSGIEPGNLILILVGQKLEVIARHSFGQLPCCLARPAASPRAHLRPPGPGSAARRRRF